MSLRLTSSLLFIAAIGALSGPSFAADDAAEPVKAFQEMRFGMFVHWGIYSILGRGEWVMNNEKIPIAEYEPLQKQFNPAEFNADEWVSLAKEAGQKYLTFTSKHHDGFCMFDSALTDYTSMHAPCHRDFCGELVRACRKQGLKIMFYYSLLDWHHSDYQTNLPKYLGYCHGQVRELCTKYGPIDGIWFDGGWEHSAEEWQAQKLVTMIRQLQPNAVINDRSRYDGDFGTPEQQVPGGPQASPWESCITINNSWGHNAGDRGFKSAPDIVRMLVDIVGKGGNLLLNAGPLPTGRIPVAQAYRLRQVGEWMKANGESIYGCTASPFPSTPWGRCTVKGNRLYVHLFDWPEVPVALSGLQTPIKSAFVLRGRQPVKVDAGGGEPTLALPEIVPDLIDTVVVVELDGPPKIDTAIRAAADGTFTLPARLATVHGTTARYEDRGQNIGYWTDKSDWVSWEIVAPEDGSYAVQITLACEKGTGGSTYTIEAGESKVEGTVKETESWTDFATIDLGALALTKGRIMVAAKPKTMPGFAVMNLQRIVLKPVR